MKTFHDGKVTLHAGDCFDVLEAMPENSFDAVVTDPPYHLTSIAKRFGAEDAAPPRIRSNMHDKVFVAPNAKQYVRLTKGFMGKQWDGGDIAFRPELWAEVLRVLKPGGHMVCFGGTRTYHRMVCAIEDAGFEVRDQLAWVYSQGFPKSHNISRNLDEVRCGCRSDRAQPEHNVHGMWEQHVPASVHAGEGDREILFQSLQEHSSSAAERKELPDYAGADEPCMEGWGNVSQEARELRQRAVCPVPARSDFNGEAGRICDGASPGNGETHGESTDAIRMRPSSGPRSAQQQSDESGTVAVQSEPQKRGAWAHCEQCGKPVIPDGLGTALKPAWEPICLARKPLSESTVAANVLHWGTGAINIDGCRIPTNEKWDANELPDAQDGVTWGGNLNKQTSASHELGRWPANLCHDGSPEVLAGFPETASSDGCSNRPGNKNSTSYGFHVGRGEIMGFGDSGSAARFFASFPQDDTAKRFHYTSKADADDRLNSKHPTVKPVDLMQWLVRLVCPKGATVLDPFAGTGTTGAASFIEGRRCVLIEREAEYLADIEKRMSMLLMGSEERSWKLAKPEPLEALPLFALTGD